MDMSSAHGLCVIPSYNIHDIHVLSPHIFFVSLRFVKDNFLDLKFSNHHCIFIHILVKLHTRVLHECRSIFVVLLSTNVRLGKAI